MEITVKSVQEMQRTADDFVKMLRRGIQATVVGLSGELGAGKTTFTQAVARALGITESVTSPTFVLEKIYPVAGHTFERLIHIDAYRLESARELEILGWSEIAAAPGNLILLEWPEKVAPLIPADAIRIRFDIEGEARTISINGGEKEN